MRKQKHLRLTVVCENVVGNLSGIGEHGFSVFIESETGTYLFDTGQGIGILPNTLTFAKDLRRVGKIVLSHGHYDHTGGLRDVLKITGPVDVHAHPAVFEEKYAVSEMDGRDVRRFIGMPHRRESLEPEGGVFKLGSSFREIDEGIYLTGEIPRLTPFETGGDARLYAKRGNDLVPDDMPDDGALVIATEKGLVVLLGCAHAGTVNTLEHIRKNVPGEPILALIGGTHWGFLPDAAVDASIASVKEMDIGTIGVCHCTGIAVASRLMREFGKSCFYASVGTVFEL